MWTINYINDSGLPMLISKMSKIWVLELPIGGELTLFRYPVENKAACQYIIRTRGLQRLWHPTLQWVQFHYFILVNIQIVDDKNMYYSGSLLVLETQKI